MVKRYKKEEIVSGVVDFIKDAVSSEALSEVATTLSEVARGNQSAKTAYVYTVFKLTDSQKEAIKRKLEKEVNHEVILRQVIDKKLLGGFKIKLGDWVYDASIIGQLNDFKSEIYANI